MTYQDGSALIGERYNNNSHLEATGDRNAADGPWKAGQKASILQRRAIRPAHMIEIGCSSGEILAQLAKRLQGTKFTGYELSSDAFAICRLKQTERVRFVLGNAPELDESFDVAMAIDVYKDVEDPFSFARGLRELSEWKVFKIPLGLDASALMRKGFKRVRSSIGHLYYFAAETALATSRETGYDIKSHSFTPAFKSLEERNADLMKRLVSLPRKMLYGISTGFLSKTLAWRPLLMLAR